MSTHYNTEPPPTASATLHTTAGSIHISLFARQTPLACKNFLQHCLDGYYVGTTFHRIVPGFVVQAGDPTGTGAGGAAIYDDPEFERDYSRDREHGEKVVFRDEIHSRLRFNRRGLVGMAKSEDGGYGSQFFVTLAPAERELTGSCTLFGRVEGEGIYNVVKIAEGELVEGAERPVYAVRITGCEVDDLGPFKGVLHKREKVAAISRPPDEDEEEEKEKESAKRKKAKKKQAKGAKALLSFGADEGGEGEDQEAPIIPVKRKFNPKIVADADADVTAVSQQQRKETKKGEGENRQTSRQSVPPRPSETSSTSKPARKRSRSPQQSHSPPINRKPPRDPTTQIPVPDPESPSRSPSPPSATARSPGQTSLSRTNAEIASLKASMRRNGTSASAEPPRKKTALESLIPETSIRGRKRPAAGKSSGDNNNGLKVNNSSSSAQDDEALRVFNAFRAKLENAAAASSSSSSFSSGHENRRARKQGSSTAIGATAPTTTTTTTTTTTGEGGDDEDEEAQLCDLHFIANCQSCRAWDAPTTAAAATAAAAAEGEKEGPDSSASTTHKPTKGEADADYSDSDSGGAWMTHRLRFAKDTLGKDASWKRDHPEDVDGLMVIDPRQKEKEIVGGGGGPGAGRKRERERKRKMEEGGGGGGPREWDRDRDRDRDRKKGSSIRGGGAK